VSARTGLAAEVPTLGLCREMAAIPALAEAFKGSILLWASYEEPLWTDSSEPRICGYKNQPVRLTLADELEVFAEGGHLEAIGKKSCAHYVPVYPAPTPLRMLRLLKALPDGIADSTHWKVSLQFVVGPGKCDKFRDFDITDPDALARACIEAAL
jgi:hypothetical protein